MGLALEVTKVECVDDEVLAMVVVDMGSEVEKLVEGVAVDVVLKADNVVEALVSTLDLALKEAELVELAIIVEVFRADFCLVVEVALDEKDVFKSTNRAKVVVAVVSFLVLEG